LNTLDKDLESDLDWRRSELASLKVLVLENKNRGDRQSALLRSLWLLLYAHFEGFCKTAIELYADFLNKQNVTCKSLVEPLVITSLERVFRELEADKSHSGKRTFMASLNVAMESPAAFELTVDTSNLWAGVLAKILTSIDIKCVYLEETHTRINALVGRRNAIAHGKAVFVNDLAAYQEFEDAAILIMTEIALAICESADHRRFVR
jgi:hypothetical protein